MPFILQLQLQMKGEQSREDPESLGRRPWPKLQTYGWEQTTNTLSDTRQAPEAKPPSKCKEQWDHREQEQIYKIGAKWSCIAKKAPGCNSFPFKLPRVLTFHHFRVWVFCSIHVFWTMKISGSVLFCKFVCISTITLCWGFQKSYS